MILILDRFKLISFLLYSTYLHSILIHKQLIYEKSVVLCNLFKYSKLNYPQSTEYKFIVL